MSEIVGAIVKGLETLIGQFFHGKEDISTTDVSQGQVRVGSHVGTNAYVAFWNVLATIQKINSLDAWSGDTEVTRGYHISDYHVLKAFSPLIAPSAIVYSATVNDALQSNLMSGSLVSGALSGDRIDTPQEFMLDQLIVLKAINPKKNELLDTDIENVDRAVLHIGEVMDSVAIVNDDKRIMYPTNDFQKWKLVTISTPAYKSGLYLVDAETLASDYAIGVVIASLRSEASNLK
jgi:hypothetical protein